MRRQQRQQNKFFASCLRSCCAFSPPIPHNHSAMKRIISAIVVYLAISLWSGQICASQTCSWEQELIPDCNCSMEIVNEAVTKFLSPLLTNITTSTYFRYFLVDLEKPCPFWSEYGQCAMEGCSVCTCDEKEIPSAWLYGSASGSSSKGDFGWVSNGDSVFGFDAPYQDESLGQLTLSTREQPSSNGDASELREGLRDHSYRTLSRAQRESDSYLSFLFSTENCNRPDHWTVLGNADHAVSGVYVNLLKNPERFTGYAGPSAGRVWRAITEENCFAGEGGKECLEQRVFSRLITGLRASISVHIARQFRYNTGEWGENLPLYWGAVGSHVERAQNVYFSFLFLLRATAKASRLLETYPFITGDRGDDEGLRDQVKTLLSSLRGEVGGMGSIEEESQQTSLHVPYPHGAVQDCSYAFDERSLFDVVGGAVGGGGGEYWRELEEKQRLREDFRLKFRNISQVMDCVSCDKCRVWGKLQLLGFGTAIKVLLSPETEIRAAIQKDRGVSFLNRQEVIALVNTLNQFAKSVEFMAYANKVKLADERAVEERELANVTRDRGLEAEREGEEGGLLVAVESE